MGGELEDLRRRLVHHGHDEAPPVLAPLPAAPLLLVLAAAVEVDGGWLGPSGLLQQDARDGQRHEGIQTCKADIIIPPSKHGKRTKKHCLHISMYTQVYLFTHPYLFIYIIDSVYAVCLT